MSHFLNWRCINCGKEYELDEVHYLCTQCSKKWITGSPLIGVLEAIFDYQAIAREWEKKQNPRLFSVLDEQFYPPIPVGNTPLFKPDRLNKNLNLPNLFIKNDALNPSGSLKDRASELVVADAIRLGIDKIVCASTGNAASSLACICAAAGKEAIIFVPKSIPKGKLVQIKVHGAKLYTVSGTYDDAFNSALAYSANNDCLNRNTAFNPLTIEGKKTAGIEIYLQLNDVPDWIIIPVGDGVILSGIYKAFIDLKAAGIIDHLPKLLSVQAESSDAITAYWETGTYHNAHNPQTIADSISVKTPANAHWAVNALYQTQGKSVRVSDNEILSDQKYLAQMTGIFVEPSSAAVFSGLRKALTNKWIKPEEKIVMLSTGTGLKDINAIKL
ncbi:MAG: threonine synthase [Candidatus Cloacimonadaceae bacterium]|jgi:threonine synthase|nr:threonine synthase [Candidatus Cloacimonadota bacterium]MDY0111362.1 threonine synthase [Candidatus Syntrophosphaera sp.]